jgi:hypothetical protein
MQKLPSNVRWMIILGGYFGSKLLRGAAKSNPALSPYVMPLVIAYALFAVLTWLAAPVFNLLLFVHPYGRHALNDDQRTQARWVGVCLSLALGSLGVWFASGRSEEIPMAALVFGLLTLPVAAIHSCDEGWPRTTMLVIALVLVAAGCLAVGILYILVPPQRSSLTLLGYGALGLFAVGVMISQWVAIWLMNQTPKR